MREGWWLSALKISKHIPRWWGWRLGLSRLHVDYGLLHGLRHLCLHSQHLLNSRQREWRWVGGILVVLPIVVHIIVVVAVSRVGHLKYEHR
jgi:hypothetical protein